MALQIRLLCSAATSGPCADVVIGTTPVGSIITGAIISAAGARAALLTGAAACLVAAAIAARVRTPPHVDAALTDLATP